MQPSLLTLASNDRSLVATNDLVGRQHWPYQPSTGARTTEVNQKAHLDILDPRSG